MFDIYKFKYKKTLLLLFILSLISLIQSSFKALKNSCDLQWFPSKLLSEGINHYKYFIEGGEPFMCQLENMHMDYKLFYYLLPTLNGIQLK